MAQAEIPLEKSQQETRAPADDALTQNVAAAEEEPNLLAKAPEEEFRLLAAVPDAELTQEDDTPAENDGILPPTFKVAQPRQILTLCPLLYDQRSRKANQKTCLFLYKKTAMYRYKQQKRGLPKHLTKTN